MKTYILANKAKRVLTKQDTYSSEVRVPRMYSTLTQANRFAEKFSACVFTVNAPALVGNGYATYDAIKKDAKALGLSVLGFSY